MVFISYNGKTELYLTDVLDPQKLYNSARNIEIAAWKLAHAHDARGEPLLLSNEVRFHDAEEATAAGFHPCEDCRPPLAKAS